jgi:voltage-gated potassium channel Kch
VISRLVIAWALVALCVVIHATGVLAALRRLPSSAPRARRFVRSTRIFIEVAAWMILLHMLEITAWATVYYLNHAMPDLPSSVYFSAVTYTTTGYGDVLLPPEWRLVGGIEALTGILMCGWSTAFFFAAVNRMYQGHPTAKRQRPTAATAALTHRNSGHGSH